MSNEDTIGGKVKQAWGKTEQAVGNAVGNEKLANKGVADQTTGAVKETWGNAKDAVNEASTTAHAHNAEHRESLSQKIDSAKESVNEKIDNYKAEKRAERAG